MDILIKNARIIDGTGAPAYTADIGIKDGRITCIGRLNGPCAEEIDAAGRFVTPGFIDAHSHADVGIFDPVWSHQRIVQGITTELTGHCGPSPAPNCPEQMELLRRIYFELTGTGKSFDWPFEDFSGWLEEVERQPLSANYGFFVGHGTIRACVMGGKREPASDLEIRSMQRLLAAALEQGAMGLGLGLSMFPGAYADTRELIALAKVVKAYDGIIASHRRDEGKTAYESVEEMIEIARATGVRMNISHVKVTGTQNWGKGKAILNLIQRGLDEGLDLSLDAYPYLAGYTQLFQIFPISVWGEGPSAMLAQFRQPERRREIVQNMLDGTFDGIVCADGGAAGIQIIQCPDPRFDKKTLAQISQEIGENPAECAIRMIEQFGAGLMMFYFLQKREELNEILRFPPTMVISDGTPSSGHGHPRYMGAFGEALETLAKGAEPMPLEAVIPKMTSMPARRYRLKDRGEIAVGKIADLVVLDWDHFHNNCTYEAPEGPSKGIDYVLLNGVVAARNGIYSGNGRGQVLRGGVSCSRR